MSCSKDSSDSRLTAILAGLANNPEFIRVVGRRYSSYEDAPTMEELVTALKMVEESWKK